MGKNCEHIMSHVFDGHRAKEVKELELFVLTRRANSVKPFNACHAAPLLLGISDEVDDCVIRPEDRPEAVANE